VRPGERVGNYTILELLGKGGFGAVFKARDEVTGALVALKAVHPDHARDPDFVKRLRDEARAAAAVSHPHVAVFHTSGEHQGIPYLVFELVGGGTLDRLVRDRGPLPWREACARGAEVASALAALHRAGIVHRDVKPENVLLDGEGRAKLADFGLVRLDRGQWHSLSGSLTGEGEIVGTFAFMSPEQADGAKDLDGRADLYALGALIFMLLTGRPPFEGRGMEVLARLAKSPPPSPRSLARDVPARLDRLVLALLAKERDARPRDALTVQEELEAIASETEPGVSAIAKALMALAAVAVLALAGLSIALRAAPPPEAIAPPPPAPAPTPGAPAPPPPLVHEESPRSRRSAPRPRRAIGRACSGSESRTSRARASRRTRSRASGGSARPLAPATRGACSGWPRRSSTGRASRATRSRPPVGTGSPPRPGTCPR
jgi:serine/threonine-protein kinase